LKIIKSYFGAVSDLFHFSGGWFKKRKEMKTVLIFWFFFIKKKEHKKLITKYLNAKQKTYSFPRSKESKIKTEFLF
jgi:hypothetical protein